MLHLKFGGTSTYKTQTAIPTRVPFKRMFDSIIFLHSGNGKESVTVLIQNCAQRISSKKEIFRNKVANTNNKEF